MRALHLYTTTRSFFEEQLAALEARGIDCTAVGVPGEYEPDSPRTAADYARYLPRVLNHSLDEYDLVHANYGLTAPFALAQPTRPVVFTPWGTDLLGDRRWLTGLSRLSARAADAVVLPSRACASAVPGDHPVVPFGVDLDRFRPVPRAEARERVGWDPDERVVLFPYDPARPEKDYPRARRAVAAADVDADLRILTGVPHEAVPLYMNASDAVLVTSTREAGPMVVKEAAACNVPVVSTDVGFVRETLSGVSNCRVCDDEAALVDGLEAVLDGERRSDGRSTVDGLGIERMGERLAEVYRRVGRGEAVANV
ncbi:glycosyltransferase family 4 protein [Halosimplex salinum]|uniref:glycosyltransferase family 4 protein n=1 Tax=Halosimplex salinum TaxID=1710538 RepID=UPI000F46A4E9|nr:glycosyltransferase family 4 protein [Halosimplex salinum]